MRSTPGPSPSQLGRLHWQHTTLRQNTDAPHRSARLAIQCCHHKALSRKFVLCCYACCQCCPKNQPLLAWGLAHFTRFRYTTNYWLRMQASIIYGPYSTTHKAHLPDTSRILSKSAEQFCYMVTVCLCTWTLLQNAVSCSWVVLNLIHREVYNMQTHEAVQQYLLQRSLVWLSIIKSFKQ